MQNNDPEGSNEYITWILSQLKGITHGLSKIHVRKVEIAGAKRVAPPATNLEVPGATPRSLLDGGTGYHHDIKPQNILLLYKLDEKITTPSPERGVLQIADFGVGKLHTEPPNGPSKGTKNQRGTPTYAAPESVIKPSPKKPIKISRPYDVWSLGCVITEVLVWLVLGKEEWQNFNLNRTGWQSDDEVVETDGFYYVDTINGEKKAKLRDCVEEMFKTLRRRSEGSQCLGLLVSLAHKILDVNPATRIEAKDLAEELEDIIAVARTEPAAQINIGNLPKAVKVVKQPHPSVRFDDTEHINQIVTPGPSQTTISAPSITITPIDRTDTERTELSQSTIRSMEAHRSTPPDSPTFTFNSLR